MCPQARQLAIFLPEPIELPHGPPLDRFRIRPHSLWLLLLTILAGARLPSFAVTHPGKVPVILISVDTLRADHLSLYGYHGLSTPAIDAMAKHGTVLTQATTQVPLTLPSHVSLFTSTYPFWNGVEDNGQVLTAKLPTLATVFKAQGYATGAFIGGFALDKRFGMDRGFDVYNSPFNVSQQESVAAADLKRPAEEVIHSAETWLDGEGHRPFFLFVHLYDLHTPYQPHPQVQSAPGVSGYDEELAYVNSRLQEFFSFLRTKGIFDKALIIFVSDHGESLGEHGESTHGYFIYQSTLHVPVIFHWPMNAHGAVVRAPLPASIDEPAGLVDLAPTIFYFLGISPPPGFQGSSLFRAASADSPESGIYSESLYAHDHYGCDPIFSLRSGRYKYIEAPKPELYDLDADPGETTNLYATQRTVARSLHQKLHSLLALSPDSSLHARSALSPEASEQLRALGYMPSNGSVASHANTGIDPKDRIVSYEETHRAISLAYAGDLKGAVTLLKQVVASTPDLPESRNILGLFQQKLGLHQDAAASFREVLQRDPSNAIAHYNLAVSYFNLGQMQNAIREIEVLRALASTSGRALKQLLIPAEELLGTIFLQEKDLPRAQAQFQHLLILAPNDFTALYNLGWIAGLEGNLEDGVTQLGHAIQQKPDNADAHTALGTLYLRQGNLPKAQAAFSTAVRLSSHSAAAHFNLGITLAKERRTQEAAAEFRQALQIDPGFARARRALDQLEGMEKQY
jgi:choline-sulfatase